MFRKGFHLWQQLCTSSPLCVLPHAFLFLLQLNIPVDHIMLFKKAIKKSLPWAGPDGGYYMISITKVKKRYPTHEGEVYELVILPGKEKRKLKTQFYREVIIKSTTETYRKTKISLKRHSKAFVPDCVKHVYCKLTSRRTRGTVMHYGFQKSHRTCETIPFVENEEDNYYRLLKASSYIDQHDEMFCPDWRDHKLVIHEMNVSPAYPHPFTTYLYSNNDSSSMDEQSFHISRCPSKKRFPETHPTYGDNRNNSCYRANEKKKSITLKEVENQQTRNNSPTSGITKMLDSDSTLEVGMKELNSDSYEDDQISNKTAISDPFYDFESVRELNQVDDKVYEEILTKLQKNFPSYQYPLRKVPSIKVKKVMLYPGAKEPLYYLTSPRVKFAREGIQIEYCSEKGTESIPQLIFPHRHRYPLPLKEVAGMPYSIVLPYPFISSMRPESVHYEELLSSYDSSWFWIRNFPIQTFFKYVDQEVKYWWHGLKDKTVFKWDCLWSPLRFRLRKDYNKLDGHMMKPRDSNIKVNLNRFSLLEFEDDWGNDFCEGMFEGVYL